MAGYQPTQGRTCIHSVVGNEEVGPALASALPRMSVGVAGPFRCGARLGLHNVVINLVTALDLRDDFGDYRVDVCAGLC